MVSILHRPFIASSCIVLIYFMHMYVCMVGEYFCIFVCVEPYIWGCTGIYVCMVGKPGSNVEYLPPFLPFYELKYEFACQCGQPCCFGHSMSPLLVHGDYRLATTYALRGFSEFNSAHTHAQQALFPPRQLSGPLVLFLIIL